MRTTQAQRNHFDARARALVGQPLAVIRQTLITEFGISRDQAIGSMMRVKRGQQEKSTREHVISIRLNDEELEKFNRLAEAAGGEQQAVRQWIREAGE